MVFSEGSNVEETEMSMGTRGAHTYAHASPRSLRVGINVVLALPIS